LRFPVHEVGKRIRVSGATVCEYIRQAVREKYFVQIGKHCINPNGKGKSRTYRFYASRHPIATELMRDNLKRPPGIPPGAMDDD
jgi:hypothetical protein